ncbi:isoleucine--tRNA ligase [Citricoccus sp. NR2]|uniref:isoleucine--tRNA ligase n=1 Tax=Citricoccus sp. NR2 TaxID=3004095 RepID=UPI0022DD0CC4|nr:isoleucine--tRNA ligase [Citricoccus sp. NR2]WBL18415.1 isoleucine--tRNA ligase [Citricoccus sp. NR2]
MYPLASSDPHTVGSTPATPRFPEIEERVLRYWDEDGTFLASVDQRPAENPDGSPNEFVFYDGPPFANGLPHYGHLLTGYVKDLVARYQTQQGRRVERRFGWDTHGLPAELEAMKQLGMNDKAQIESMGIDKFNDACRASVLKYTEEWKNYVNRQARWVDFENDYKTLNPEFMESVLWAFKSLHEKGLTYQGFRVLPYCWKDETPLSNHELRMDDDVYQNRQDPSVTVAFEILGAPEDASLIPDGGIDAATAASLTGVRALGWTTTPWTLPTNLALAVGPEVTYAVVPIGPNGASVETLSGTRFLLAEDLVGAHASDLGYASAEDAVAAVTERYVGASLAGLRYAPLFDYFTDAEKYGTEAAFRFLADDYVTTTDGTGIVHQAPAYGEDDQRVTEANGIPVVLSVDEGARFLPLFGDKTVGGGVLKDIAGVQVFDANRTIIRALRAQGQLVREASYEHSYPHCWRCRTPLIYRAITSWYVSVTEFKQRMVDLNQEINWIPENVKDGQFGRWLENARDWSISRNRYWGSPIPVWESDNPEFPRREVYGSIAEIEEAFGTLPRNADGEVDLHRPWIDELVRPNPDDPTGASMMRRVPDVLDVWFDSGSMPYAQVHYPMQNKDWFDPHHPADFIVEYIGQTRGWFYTMHILSTALFDRPAYKNVISHGIVLGSDGQKMSKSLRNYPDVSEVLDRDGSDAMRWFLMSSPILRGGNLIVTEEGIREATRQVILPVWNAFHFFTLYANTATVNGTRPDGYRAQTRYSSDDPLDQYILAATGTMVREVKTALDSYEVSDACDALRTYVDVLTNWYIRRSRTRFFDEDPVAFDVLYTVLEATVRAAAPLMPLVAEEIWRGLTGGRSVHLTDYPDAELFPSGPEAERMQERMDLVRTITSAGSSLRKTAQRRVRLPLRELSVVVPDAAGLEGAYRSIIADELNVQSVNLLDASEASPEDFGITQQLVVNARAAGPRLGKNVQTVIKAAKSGDWSIDADGAVVAGGLELVEGEYALATQVDPAASEGENVVSVIPGGFLMLATDVDDVLAAEGVARDTVRAVQAARKAAGLEVSDRVTTTISGPATVIAAITAHRDLIADETLSTEVEFVENGAEDKRASHTDDASKSVQVTVTRVEGTS